MFRSVKTTKTDMSLKRSIGEESPHHKETLLKVLVGERRKQAEKIFKELCDGEAQGFLFMLRVTGEPLTEMEPDEDGRHLEGIHIINGLPVAAVIRAVVDQYDMSASDVVEILEMTRTEGNIVKH